VVRAVASVSLAAGVTGAVARLAGRAHRTGTFAILSYHRVNDDGDPFFPALPTDVFERQVAHIAHTYRVLTVEDIVARMPMGGPPRNAVALTFDDGYRDNLVHAAPILTRHRVRATIFLATGLIGSAQVPWYDRVARAFKLTSRRHVETPWTGSAPLDGEAARLHALERALARLKRVPGADLEGAVRALIAALDVTEPSGGRNEMLDWDDVRALTQHGFAVGAHTVGHPILSRLAADAARAEIEGSRDAIAAALGSAPRAFAYPNGGADDYSPAVVQLVRDAGFTCAVTTRFGLNTTTTSPWELRRGGPWEHHLPTFALKLAWYRLSAAWA
jgi:peptidoglycan/xylan/chitin deacetylase (PgdA/CDA1 family)